MIITTLRIDQRFSDYLLQSKFDDHSKNDDDNDDADDDDDDDDFDFDFDFLSLLSSLSSL